MALRPTTACGAAHAAAYSSACIGRRDVAAVSDRTRLENALLAVEAEARAIVMADYDDVHTGLGDAIEALDALRDEIRNRAKGDGA
jgi:hypothetical protein